jgi:hypothetical protein
MPETGPGGTSSEARHRLAWLDYVAYELFRSTGRSQLMQCLWLYDREVDRAALARTYDRLAALSFNRLIEPSPLPLARPRWVKPAGPPEPIEMSAEVLPRSQLMPWANRHARRLIDPVAGPAWRMAIQHFDDGITVVSIVGSHLVLDGIGALRAIEAAANAVEVPNHYLPLGRRGRFAGAMSDMGQILLDTPLCLAALTRMANAGWHKRPAETATSIKAANRNGNPGATIELAVIAAGIAARDWDACARRLGGHPNTLLHGFVATLAARLGRRRASDGAVSLIVPVDRRRGLDDNRALAIAFRSLNVAPEPLTQDLRPLSAPLKALLLGVKDNETDALASLLPAIAWMPRTFATALVNRLFTYDDDRPVSCSNLGTLRDGLARIDGTPCQRILARAVDVNVTRRDLARSQGHLVIVASRYRQTVTLCIEACQLDPSPTTAGELREATAQTLAEFALEAIIEI